MSLLLISQESSESVSAFDLAMYLLWFMIVQFSVFCFLSLLRIRQKEINVLSKCTTTKLELKLNLVAYLSSYQQKASKVL